MDMRVREREREREFKNSIGENMREGAKMPNSI
jgi:hypothetical protein